MMYLDGLLIFFVVLFVASCGLNAYLEHKGWW